MPSLNSLKLFMGLALGLLAVTIWLLPLPTGSRLFLLTVTVFGLVFVTVEAGGKGKTFAALTIAALSLYLLVTAGRGVLLIQTGGFYGALLGVSLILLPCLGAWAMVREIIFGARAQQLAQELEASGQLPVDDLPRSASGRIDRQAADQDFASYASQVEADPHSWPAWFRLSLAYEAAGDRKRARQALRTAMALHQGKTPAQLTI